MPTQERRIGPLERARRWSQRKLLRQAYKNIFGDVQNVYGQQVLRHMMRMGHMFEPTYVAGDTHETALREGERRLVLSIIREANIDEERIQQMTEEYFEHGSE